jgi:hypothetical protein
MLNHLNKHGIRMWMHQRQRERLPLPDIQEMKLQLRLASTIVAGKMVQANDNRQEDSVDQRR